MVLACRPGLTSSRAQTPGQTSAKGSGRVRQVWRGANSLGSWPWSRYLRAVFSSMSVNRAQRVKVMPAALRRNSLRTCLSVTMRKPPGARDLR